MKINNIRIDYIGVCMVLLSLFITIILIIIATIQLLGWVMLLMFIGCACLFVFGFILVNMDDTKLRK